MIVDESVVCSRCKKDIRAGDWTNVIVTRDTIHRQYDLCRDCFIVVIKTIENNPKRKRSKNG